MDTDSTLSEAYPEHLERVRTAFDAALEAAGADGVLVAAGEPPAYFADDQHYPYRAHPYFAWWAPLLEHPGSYLYYRPGHKPLLAVSAPVDYWHINAPVPDGPWLEQLEVVSFEDPAQLRDLLPISPGRLALLGIDGNSFTSLNPVVNPPPMVARLDWHRACKSAYEVLCIRRASVVACRAHRAAEAAFHGGGSELDIHLAYLEATRQTEPDLPYPSIVALNQHGSVLHYQRRDREAPENHHSLLLDAGAGFRGYACDITRTHARRPGLFADLVAALDIEQQKLAGRVAPGMVFPELHHQAHEAVARILAQLDIVGMEPEDMIGSDVTRAFFPHGLGHLLGLQVHDVGGQLADPDGRVGAPPTDYPSLRLTRRLQEDMVITIEPGIYFIDSLLETLRQGPLRDKVNWSAIDELRRCGGVRIEDDVVVTESGNQNLSRPLLGST